MNATDTKVYIRFFRHFAERLSERYNVLISFEEYLKLCTVIYLKKAKFEIRNGQKGQVGYIEIKGINIKCVRSLDKHKAFITALPKQHK